MDGSIHLSINAFDRGSLVEAKNITELADDLWLEILVFMNVETVMKVRETIQKMRDVVDSLPQNYIDRININDQQATKLLYRTTDKEPVVTRDRDLCQAIQQNDLDLVRAIIRSGVHINQVNDNGLTALMFAAQGGHLEGVELLVGTNNIAINQAKNNGATALMFAAQEGHQKVVKALL